MGFYRVEGLVLRSRTLGEADRVLTLLTREEGKLRAVARGSRRPRSRLLAATQPFCRGRYLLMPGRELDSITQAELVSGHSLRPLREDLSRMALASVTAELVDLLVEERAGAGEEAGALFDALGWTWEQLAQAPAAAFGPVVWWFELRLADRLGYPPRLDRCVACERAVANEVVAWFSPREGGCLCGSCQAKDPQAIHLSPEARGVLRHLRAGPADSVPRLRVSPEAGRQVETALRAFLEYRLSRPVKAWALAAELLAAPQTARRAAGTEGMEHGTGGTLQG